MIRRLIQKQDIRIAEQRLRQEHPNLLVAREISHLHRMLCLRDSQAIQKLRGLRLGIPAVELRELTLEL